MSNSLSSMLATCSAVCYVSRNGRLWDRTALLALCEGLDRWGVLELALAGGEPFAYPDLLSLLTDLADRTGLAVHLTTNGLLVPEDFAARAQGQVQQVRVSVDGLGEVYEDLRGADFARVENGLRRLRGLYLALNCLVTDRTAAQLPDYFAFAARHEVRDVLLLRPYGPAAGLLSAKPLPAVRRAVVRALEAGFRVQVACQFHDLGLPTLFPVLPCRSGREFIYIGSDGRARAASTARESYPFHDVEELKSIYRERFFPEDPARPLCRAGCFDRADHRAVGSLSPGFSPEGPP